MGSVAQEISWGSKCRTFRCDREFRISVPNEWAEIHLCWVCFGIAGDRHQWKHYRGSIRGDIALGGTASVIQGSGSVQELSCSYSKYRKRSNSLALAFVVGFRVVNTVDVQIYEKISQEITVTRVKRGRHFYPWLWRKNMSCTSIYRCPQKSITTTRILQGVCPRCMASKPRGWMATFLLAVLAWPLHQYGRFNLRGFHISGHGP